MDLAELNYYYTKFKYGEDISHALMPFKVREVLIISTFYDAFVFEQDGRLSEQVVGEFHQLNLNNAPRITSVPTGADALRLLREREFDLVITTMRIGPLSPFALAEVIRAEYPGLPILLLLNQRSDIAQVARQPRMLANIDQAFFWNGDSKIFLAMIKYVEDARNVEHDTRVGLVRVVLLVEDSVAFYSRYMPELYRELMLQVQRLISEELSDVARRYRMRTRPKLLLATTYEQAMQLAEKYEDYLLCVIADVSFPRQGKLDDDAGLALIRHLQEHMPYVPLAMQSGHDALARVASDLGVHFLNKSSDALLTDLRDYIHSYLGFGEFIFRERDGRVVDVASSMAEFEERLQHISDRSLVYHAERNDFSAWLIAHGAIRIAKEVRPGRPVDFPSVEALRQYLIDVFKRVREQKNRGRLVEFEPHALVHETEIVRMCDGSLGGKGRGIAFLNALLTTMNFRDRFPGIQIRIPHTVLIGTGEYDWFVKTHRVTRTLAQDDVDNEVIKQTFLQGALSPDLRSKLWLFLDQNTRPIAVRSSGLLEDSQSQPFAGIYESFMLPNNHPDKAVRMRQLEDAVRLVFASTWSREAKSYVRRTNNRVEDEKMAVMIMEVVGEEFDGYFYPHMSGVAQSYNYYPTSYASQSDGVAVIALGMGQWIVTGNPAFRFCPKYPKIQPFPDNVLFENSQREFYAIDLRNDDFDLTLGESATLVRLDLDVAEKHGTLAHLASVWDPRDERIRENPALPGPRILTFADIFKYEYLPVAEVLGELLELGQAAFGGPVEIEFAIKLKRGYRDPTIPGFYLLQIRPLSVQSEALIGDVPKFSRDDIFLYTRLGMGNGIVDDIRDIIYVQPDAFDNTKTLDMLEELRKLNDTLPEDASYILIGPGRWGSRDRYLGVPVRWADINRARVIVEAALANFAVEASQGTHFFHNLVSMNGGYFTVPLDSDQGYVDWAWLEAQPVAQRTRYFVHLHRDEPFVVAMYGKDGTALAYKHFEAREPEQNGLKQEAPTQVYEVVG